jgi:Ca-activated chloride channel homolog
MKSRIVRRQQKYPIYLLGAALLILIALTATPLWTLPGSGAAPMPLKQAQTVTQTPQHSQQQPPQGPIQSTQPATNDPTGTTGSKKLPPGEASDGSLQIVRDRDDKRVAGEFCPLKHTDVDAEISGFLARVTVTQEFVNPSSDKVEAIYIFPLPQDAAVDDMTMEVGGRTIRGLIKKREEAQLIYQAARNAGHTAALLDQERPNIFTQSVANIPPGGTVKVKISYVEVLRYEAGVYEFVYPMVVGPRYIPGNITGKQAGGWSHDTDQVRDASRITPVTAGVHRGVRGSRAGHDISLEVRLDAGVDIREMKSMMHEVDVQRGSAHRAMVRLRKGAEIPNRDFVLKYDVAGARITDALLTHSIGRERAGYGGHEGDSNATRGFFSFILQPPDRVSDEDATPRELIFVLDTSGSMSGYPLETAKKTMKRAIESMRAGDTFNFITFAGDTHVLFPQPVPATSANIRQAVAFMEGRRGGGGTEMMKAIRTALGDRNFTSECPPNADCMFREKPVQSAVRIVCFMTDGYVGNDMAIIDEVQKHPEARVFSFGIGTSVNRFLLDKMAEAGRGEAEFVLRPEDAEKAADRFYERVHTPVLTDVSIDWNGLPVTDVLPARTPDLFSAKPLVVTGRYTYPASGMIKLRGKRAGKPFERQIRVTLPGEENANRSLAQLWARTKIHALMSQDWNGMQNGTMKPALQQAITQLGLDYRLMTQFTSFVAVEEQTVVEGGRTRTIQVPVEMPQGVNPDTVFGRSEVSAMQLAPGSMQLHTMAKSANGAATSSAVVRSYSPVMPSVTAAEAVRPSKDRDAGRADELVLQDKREAKKKAADKLHPSLMKIYECWSNAGRSTTASCAGLVDGKVKVLIQLQGNYEEGARLLKERGIVTSALNHNPSSGWLTATVAMHQLDTIVGIANVKLVALQK